MTERDDIDGIDALAAEFVLGTLPDAERRAVNVRRRDDQQLDAAIQRWEQRLSPMLDAVPPVAPPKTLFNQITSQIADRTHARRDASVIPLDQHLKTVSSKTRSWKFATAASSAIAASLAGFIIVSGPASKPMSPKYVAVLQEESTSPAFLMSIDMKSHMCAIKTVISPPSSDKSYELWMVHKSWSKPRSLGLVAQNDMEMMPMSPDIEPDLYMDATFAVSLEPAGGSPTGQPTGPVMYAGRLMQSMP